MYVEDGTVLCMWRMEQFCSKGYCNGVSIIYLTNLNSQSVAKHFSVTRQNIISHII